MTMTASHRRRYIPIATALPLVCIFILVQSAVAQIAAPHVSFEAFRLAPGESQTRDMSISLSGITEFTITDVTFRDGEMAGFLSVDKDLPFTVSSPAGSGSDAIAVIPIVASVPSSYDGTGDEPSVHIELNYISNNRSNSHTITQEIAIIVEDDSEIWPIFGIGAAIAAAGAIYGFHRQKSRRHS